MLRVVLDENVSLQAGERLSALGYRVLSIAKHPARGMADEAVFLLAVKNSALLITRDSHFTNPVRFPPKKTGGILYLTSGNLRSSEEANLVERYLRTHRPKDFSGHLIFLSLGRIRIR